MPSLLLFCVAMLAGGAALTIRALGNHAADEADPPWRPGPWEYAATSTMFALALAIAVGWALLLCGAFREYALLGAAVVVLALSAPTIVRALPRRDLALENQRAVLVSTFAILAVAIWLGLITWASSVVYFQNNDALGYHMPRAALLAKAGAFHVFDGADERWTWPIDFELLIAQTIALARTDRLAGVIPAFGYAAFLLQAGALVERWWGRGLHALAVVLVLAAMPVALLHSHTHKNDTLECATTLAAFRLAALWTATRLRWLPLASVAAAVLSVGLKVNGGAVVLGTAALLGAGFIIHSRARHRPTLRALCIFGGASAALVVLLGGWPYLYNLATIHKPFVDLRLDTPMTWGHYANVWKFLYVSCVAPFVTGVTTSTVHVPWSEAPWYVPAADAFFSNFGVIAPLLLGALPFAVRRYGRAAMTARFERAMTVVPCVALGLLVVGFDLKPEGFFVGAPRFLLFLPAIVAGYTLAPAVRELTTRAPRAALAVVAAAAVLFSVTAYTYGWTSDTGILRRAQEVAERPELSRAGIQTRAAFVVDRSATPTDVIAMHAGYDSFVYPTYGAERTRRVTFLHAESGPPEIPADARWVIVDRPWNCFFGSPAFKDFGDWPQAFGRGRPSPEDRRVFDAVSRDPAFRLVWRLEATNQAVFLRVGKPSGL